MDDFEQRKAAYEARARELVGKELSSVLYVGMEDSEFPCDKGHEIDFGLDLAMGDGSTFGFVWPTSTPYYLQILPRSATSEVDTPRTWDMTASPEWSPFVRQQIAAATVGWATYPPTGWRYAQDLELTFADVATVWITTLETDNVYVVFEEEIARRYKLGSYASQVAS